jgi:hypothetical protein
VEWVLECLLVTVREAKYAGAPREFVKRSLDGKLAFFVGFEALGSGGHRVGG